MEGSIQNKIRDIFTENPNLRFSTEEIWALLDEEYAVSTIQVTISKLKSEKYGFKSFPRLDLVNYSEDYKKPRWGLRGARTDYGIS